jgi:outer membrane receptor protein involved in Fe transport
MRRFAGLLTSSGWALVVFFALLGCLTCPTPAFAQIDQGSFLGRVTDPSGAIVAGATVHALNVGTNVSADTTTNETGFFEFPLLPVGRYVLTVEKGGFRKSATAPIELHAGTKPRVDVALQVGEVTEAVTVTSDAPLVNATSTELGTVIDERKVAELPLNGRNFTQLFSLQNGYNLGGQSARGGVEFNGLSSSGNNFLMDGVTMSFGELSGIGIAAIGGTGTLINTLSVDAIEEFKTSVGAYSADYGRASGAVINLTTKSGTNAYHGSAWEYFRNNKMDATDFISNKNNLGKAKLRQNQFGGNLGGPLLKNRLFFFFNYEGARVVRGAVITGNIPTPALISQIKNPLLLANFQLYPTAFTATSNPLVGLHNRHDSNLDTEDTTLSRLDANLWQQHLSFRLAWNTQTVSNATLFPGYRTLYPIPFKNISAADIFNIGANKTMELRYGYNHWPIARHIQSTDTSQNQPLYGTDLARMTTTANVSGLTRTFVFNVLNSDSPVHSFVDNFIWVHGSHTVKAGANIEHTSSIRYQVEPIIYYYNSIPDLLNENPVSLQLTVGNPGRGYTWVNSGFYIQDEWKVNRRLQVNAGLRYDYYTTFKGPYGLATSDPYGPRVQPGKAIWDPNPYDFGPRLGLAYDVTGSGKTILRVGAAESFNPPQPYWYWDAPFVNPALSAFPNVAVSTLPANLKPVTYGSLNFDNFTKAVIQDAANIPAGLKLGFYLPTRKRPDERVYQWNFTLQHAITNDFSVQASYVGNRDIHQFATRILNLPDPKTGLSTPNIGPATLLTDDGRTWYHGLQLGANKRFSHGYAFDLYYTWQKTMVYDNADGTNEVDNTTQDFSNIAGSVGPKLGNVGHRVTLVHSYQVPTLPLGFARNTGVGRAIFQGWALQGIMNHIGGPSLNVTLGRDAVGNGRTAPDRPDAVQGVDPYLHTSNPLLFLNTAAFDNASPLAQKRFGNLGYNTAIGPAQFTWDLGVHKNFTVWRENRVNFRLEMFNWLNHPTFTLTNLTMSSPTFGQITTSGLGRSIQLALKYAF